MERPVTEAIKELSQFCFSIFVAISLTLCFASQHLC